MALFDARWRLSNPIEGVMGIASICLQTSIAILNVFIEVYTALGFFSDIFVFFGVIFGRLARGLLLDILAYAR